MTRRPKAAQEAEVSLYDGEEVGSVVAHLRYGMDWVGPVQDEMVSCANTAAREILHNFQHDRLFHQSLRNR